MFGASSTEEFTVTEKSRIKYQESPSISLKVKLKTTSETVYSWRVNFKVQKYAPGRLWCGGGSPSPPPNCFLLEFAFPGSLWLSSGSIELPELPRKLIPMVFVFSSVPLISPHFHLITSILIHILFKLYEFSALDPAGELLDPTKDWVRISILLVQSLFHESICVCWNVLGALKTYKRIGKAQNVTRTMYQIPGIVFIFLILKLKGSYWAFSQSREEWLWESLRRRIQPVCTPFFAQLHRGSHTPWENQQTSPASEGSLGHLALIWWNNKPHILNLFFLKPVPEFLVDRGHRSVLLSVTLTGRVCLIPKLYFLLMTNLNPKCVPEGKRPKTLTYFLPEGFTSEGEKCMSRCSYN